MAEKRGSIAFFTTYRPPVPLEIFSCPYPPTSNKDELPMTDGVSYNFNGHSIPPAALKTILRRPKLVPEGIKDTDVDSGRVSGLVFVSERDNLETIQFALRFHDQKPIKTKVFSFADVYSTSDKARMEDSPCIAGNYLVYVSTKEAADKPRQPWTAVYKTNLSDGKTERLTPSCKYTLCLSRFFTLFLDTYFDAFIKYSSIIFLCLKTICIRIFANNLIQTLKVALTNSTNNLKTIRWKSCKYRLDLNFDNLSQLAVVADLSPSVSPSGKMIAMASFQNRSGWDGEIQDLKTDIYVMFVDKPSNRRVIRRTMILKNGGWPTWGSEDVIFFHRKVGDYWAVFRFDMNTKEQTRVTPDKCNAMTPVAIDANTVAVATIFDIAKFGVNRAENQYRHIMVFDSTDPEKKMKISQISKPLADHFNPFVIMDGEKKRIGYHRVNSGLVKVTANLMNLL